MTTLPVLKLIITTLGTTISALRLYLEYRRGRPPDAVRSPSDAEEVDEASAREPA